MDLVVVAISGVQQFIAESRSTADLYAGSSMMSDLAGSMLAAVPDTSRLILPAPRSQSGGDGTPNRVVALADSREGPKLAAAMAANVQSTWNDWLALTFGGTGANPPASPGCPAVQWVVVPFEADEYEGAWAKAQAALTARKRIRDFPGYRVRQTGVCTLTGRWPVVPDAQVPPAAQATRRGEALSAVGHVKRWYGRTRASAFQSTWSIASAPYRDSIIRLGSGDGGLWYEVAYLKDAVDALQRADGPSGRALRRGSGALRGLSASDNDELRWLRQVEGAWCSPDTWEPDSLRRDYDLNAPPDAQLCQNGREASAALIRAARAEGTAPLTPYLAVLAQDADHMGRQLGIFPGGVDNPVAWHRRVSGALTDVARRQSAEIESVHLGRVVYAGGDDLLALLPAAHALAAARAVNSLFTDDEALMAALDRPSASTAVVFFHASWPLQSAIASAQALLKDAKKRDRPGLGVAVLNRGGERTRVVLPWSDRAASPARPTIDILQELTAAISGPLSGGLAAGLETDRAALAELSGTWLERELARRAARQGITAEHAPAAGRALAALALSGAGDQRFIDCAGSVLLARFLAAQTRVPA
jgi:CRISPR-associated protein Cmr2